MVQSSAPSVDLWMSTVDPGRGPALARLRQLCVERLHGWSERMQWGMPGYGPPDGDALVSFNSQKQHIALYAGTAAVERFAERLGAIDCGKGCIRYRRPDQIDFALVSDLLDEIRSRHDGGH